MTDKTLLDLTPQLTAPALDQPYETVETSTDSRSNTLAQLRGFGVIATTTSAVTTEIDMTSKMLLVTTGGTGGVEIINLNDPARDIDGFYNAPFTGSRVTIMLLVQTNPADVVQITINGNPTTQTYAPLPLGQGLPDDLLLDFLGAAISFVWNTQDIVIDNNFTGSDYSYNSSSAASIYLAATAEQSATLKAGNASGGASPGGEINLEAGQSAADNTGNGGGATLRAGDALGASGNGGTITIVAGTSANDDGGGITLTAGAGDHGGSVTIMGGASAGAGGLGNGVLIQGGEQSGNDNASNTTINGATAHASGHNAGNVIVQGGTNSHATGIGGDVVLTPGVNGSGTRRYVRVTNIPTADPGVSGALYSLAGTLHISP